jgi:hypothetical protein
MPVAQAAFSACSAYMDSSELLEAIQKAAQKGKQEAKKEEAAAYRQSLNSWVRAQSLIRKGLASRTIPTPGNFTAQEIAPRIILLRFETRREMTQTLLRFQEHYESPRYRNQVFSLREFKEWYPTTRPDGRFTYYSDWSGFNFPSYVLDAFYSGDFKNLTEREKNILEFFTRWVGERFYVIGTFGDVSDEEEAEKELGTARHEAGHAFYYMNDKYHRKVDEILSRADKASLGAIAKRLIAMGYHKEVIQDELHAYLLNGWERMYREGYIPSLEPVEPTIEELSDLFEKTFKEAMTAPKAEP